MNGWLRRYARQGVEGLRSGKPGRWPHLPRLPAPSGRALRRTQGFRGDRQRRLPLAGRPGQAVARGQRRQDRVASPAALLPRVQPRLSAARSKAAGRPRAVRRPGLEDHNRYYATVDERDAALPSTFRRFQTEPSLVAGQVQRFRTEAVAPITAYDSPSSSASGSRSTSDYLAACRLGGFPRPPGRSRYELPPPYIGAITLRCRTMAA